MLAVALTGCGGNGGERAEDVAMEPAGGVATAPDAPATSAPAAVIETEPGVVLFLGTSLTAGYGLGADQAYPALIQRSIDSAGLPFRVSNAGISGETSAGGLRRTEWALQQPVAVLVLELGANDGLRGLDVARMRANLDSIIRLTRGRYPDADVVIAGMEAPPNLGERYTSAFRDTFRELAAEHDAALVPFLLEGVAAVDSLNQADRLHPTAAGQRRLAANVWRVLGPVLERRARAQRESRDSP